MPLSGTQAVMDALLCSSITRSRSERGRKNICVGCWPWDTRAPGAWWGTHGLFLGMLRLQENRKC